jgi:hypothetical protein
MRGNGTTVGRAIHTGWTVAHKAAVATGGGLTGINPTTGPGLSVRYTQGLGSPTEKDRQAGREGRPIGVRVLTMGPMAFVDPGGELWTRYGMEIKRYSPFPYTWLSYSSGHYFPEAWAFEKKLYGTANRMPDWGGVVRDTALELLKEAKVE